ncbi:hypothetical protein HJG60_001799 [Phyllostomus discolor]|uniref:Uncharacterized protein n=1 Tax=Phyllostomus discolor TaxID=89673 RepID=A0A834ASB9_9CHIR|nr:hypothetical protein HJG60_001799 [Phyllostomus discolor]
MLLSLLGACIVVGPFQGPEWEPVSGLFSKDHSCRSPRCCGNLLVLCLFLIWQVRHYWHQVTRTHPSMKKVIKVPPQKWAVPSMRRDTCLAPTSKVFYSSGKCRGPDAHVRQWAQKKRRGYRRSVRESGVRYLLSGQRRCRCPPRDFHTPSKTTFCTTSFPSTCVLPQDGSRVWHVPWCLRDERTPLIGKSLPPDLDVYYQRMGQPLAHSPQKSVPLEPAVSLCSHPTSMTLAAVLPNLPSQRPQCCPGESLPFPPNQRVGIRIWNCPPEAWAPGMHNQMPGREDIRDTQAPEWGNQRDSSADHAWEIEASGRQLPRNLGMEDSAQTKGLEWGSQRPGISGSDGEILTPGWEKPGHMGAEHTAKVQKLGKRNQEKAGGENSPENQAHTVDHQGLSRCKVGTENQTSEWGKQDKSRNEDAVETQVFEKNEQEARGEDEGQTQARGLGRQGPTGSENGEEFWVLWGGKQDQTRDGTGAEVQAEERGHKGQVEGENVVRSQTPGKENPGAIKQEHGVETQAQGWGKQDCVESENARESPTPGWEKQDRGRSEKAAGELQKQLGHEFRAGWGSQGLRGGKDAGDTETSGRKSLREIREEDWVVIQTQWWEDQRPVAIEVDRDFERACWGNWVQIGGDRRAEIQAPEKRDRRKGRDGDGINTLASEIESQGQLRRDTQVDSHPPHRRSQEQFGDETSTDMQVPEMENPRVVKGEADKEAPELGAEHQGQLNNEINGKIHTPKWKNQEHIRCKDGVNTQASDAENWGESTSKTDGEAHSAEWEKEEQAGGGNGRENEAPENRSHREAGGEDGTEPRAPGEDNQSHLRGDIDAKTHVLEWKNQEQTGGENGTEIQAPEKRDQGELRGEDGAETQRPERENPGQLDSENGESHPSPGRGTWEQNGLGKNDAEDVGSEDDRKIERLSGANQKLLKSKVHGETCTSVWKNQEQMGGENGAEIQMQGERNLRGPTGEDGGETQAPGGENQGQLRGQADGEIQTQGQENQKNGGEEDAAVTRTVESRTKCIAEDAEEPEAPGGGTKDQVRERDAAKGNLPADNYGVEGPPVLTRAGPGAVEQERAVSPATCPEMKPLPNQEELFLLSSGEGKHLAGQSMAPARGHREGISPGSTQAPLKPERRRQRNPGKACGLAWRFQKPCSLAASLNLPSSRPSDLGGQAPQAATALVGMPSAHPVPSKWPGHRKGQQFLLESLMRQKIAHPKWDLRQRLILESHLLFNLLDLGPLPFARVQLPGIYTACELQRQQERRLGEAQASRPGVNSPEKPQRIGPPKTKSSKLCTQAGALEKCGLQGSEPVGLSVHLSKLRRARPPGGPRERQDVQKEAPPRAKRPAPRNPRPAAGPGCGQKRVREPSSGNRRDRKTVGPGASQTAGRAPSRARTSRAGQDHGRKESASPEASQTPRLKYQQPAPWRRASLEGGGAEQQPSSCSTDTSGFKGGLHSATESLSRTLLTQTSWSPPLAMPQHSAAPSPNRRVSDPPRLPKVGDPHVREDSVGVHASSKRDLQPRGHCCAGAVLPKTESVQGQGEPENPKGTPRNPPASKKIGFIKHLRSFPLRLCFRK